MKLIFALVLLISVFFAACETEQLDQILAANENQSRDSSDELIVNDSNNTNFEVETENKEQDSFECLLDIDCDDNQRCLDSDCVTRQVCEDYELIELVAEVCEKGFTEKSLSDGTVCCELIEYFECEVDADCGPTNKYFCENYECKKENCDNWNGFILQENHVCVGDLEIIQGYECCLGDVEHKDSECYDDIGCDDNDLSTIDTCFEQNAVKYCLNKKTTACSDNDNYCPEGCTFDIDNDCEDVQVELPNLIAKKISFVDKCEEVAWYVLGVEFELEGDWPDNNIYYSVYLGDELLKSTSLITDWDNNIIKLAEPRKKEIAGKTVRVELDSGTPEYSVEETDETDNTISYTFPDYKPDFTVTNLGIYNYGNKAELTFSFKNDATLHCIPYDVEVYVNGELVKQKEIIAGEEYSTVDWKMYTPEVQAIFAVKLVVDPADLIEESSESNNIYDWDCELLGPEQYWAASCVEK